MWEQITTAIVTFIAAFVGASLAYKSEEKHRTNDIKRENYGQLYSQMFEISDLIVRYIQNGIDLEESKQTLDKNYTKLRTEYFKIHLHMSKELRTSFDTFFTNVRSVNNRRIDRINIIKSETYDYFSDFLHESRETEILILMQQEFNNK